MQAHSVEKPLSLGPRIGVDKARHLKITGRVFGALAGVNTHPDLRTLPLGGRSVTPEEEIALGEKLRRELADLIASRTAGTLTQTLTVKSR
jgi:hypothetical protein